MRILPILAIALASSAFTQGPPPGGDMGGPPPEIVAMQKWHKTHQNVHALERTMMGLSRVIDGKSTKLSSTQAKAILAVIQQWKPKKLVTDKQAKTIVDSIRKQLNKAQLMVLDERPRFGGPGGPGGPPPGGPGGPPPGGPGGPGSNSKDRPSGPPKMPALKEYNPLNPATNPMTFMVKFQTERMNKLVSTLKTQAK